MANLKKFKKDIAVKIIKHIEREPHSYKNKDIDLEKTHLNYSIIDNGYEYYKKRLNEVSYQKNRDDIVTLCGIVVTLPKELNRLSESDRKYLFTQITVFLAERYGRNNIVNSIVHQDEKGQPHLHFNFIPITDLEKKNENMVKVVNYLKKHPNANNSEVSRALGISRKTVIRWRKRANEVNYTEKLCAFEVFTRKEFQTFHKDLRDYLNENIQATSEEKIGDYFYTGITAKNGRNYSIEELKDGTYEREVIQEVEQEVEAEKEIEEDWEW